MFSIIYLFLVLLKYLRDYMYIYELSLKYLHNGSVLPEYLSQCKI
jgi:hypothetical protein